MLPPKSIMDFVYLATPYFVSEYCSTSHTCKAQEDVDVSQEQMEKMHIMSPFQLSKGKCIHTEAMYYPNVHTLIGSDKPNLTSKPRLHELDRIKIDGKTVKVINRVASNWKVVATRLYFEGHEIQNISRDNPRTVDACQEVFTQWLEGKGRIPTTWETIIEALEEADFSEVTNDLKEILEI